MVRHEGYPISAEQKARQTLDKMAQALAEAASIISPTEANKPLTEIFPEPGQRRADTEFSLPAEREEAFREAMAKLGIGRETNITASEIGLTTPYVAIIEGGQAHKMMAELEVVLADRTTVPSEIILTATPARVIPPAEEDKAKEREVTAKVLSLYSSLVGETEYDVARQVIQHLPGFRAMPGQEQVLNAAYNLDGEFRNEKTKQFIRLGSVGNTDIALMRIDREPTEGGGYKTLGSRGIMKVVSGLLSYWDGGNPREDIGFVTSATYQPSREVDAASTMLEIERAGSSRNIGVITYGTHELASVKREEPAKPALGQLAGEAHKAAVQSAILRGLLEEASH